MKITVSSALYLLLALCMFALALWMFPRLMDPVTVAIAGETTTGIVSDIQKTKDRCGKRRRDYDCTLFSMTITYWPYDSSLTLPNGSVRGHDITAFSWANHQIWDQVTFTRDWATGSAYEDPLRTAWWHLLLFLIAMSIGVLLSLRGIQST